MKLSNRGSNRYLRRVFSEGNNNSVLQECIQRGMSFQDAIPVVIGQT